MAMASHDASADACGFLMTKDHVAPHLEHLDLNNVVVPLIMPSTLGNTETSAMVSHDQKFMSHTYFDHLGLMNA